MNEQFDNDLTNRIREVFENYDDTSAHDGWLELRKKFPEEESRRRGIIWFWWSAAAVFLLFLGMGVWIYNENAKPEKLSSKNKKDNQYRNFVAQKTESKTDKKNNAIITGGNPTNQVFGQTNSNTSHTRLFKLPKGHTHSLVAPVAPFTASTADTFIAATVDTDVTKNNNEPSQTLVSGVAKKSTAPDSLKRTQTAPKSIISMFADDQNKKDQKSTEKAKNIRFGVYAATYFNYAKGSDNQLNLGLGLSAEFRVTENLKLVSGVAIAQNSLNYANGLSLASSPMLLTGAAVSANYSAASNVSNSFVAIKNYNADLVGLDIPLNLKYEFNPKKNDSYFLAGVSSGIFINESYTYHYNDEINLGQPTQNLTLNKNFNSFYFAHTLNLAFGIGYPLGKNRLVIEPFIKYPLAGLGTQDIRFGASGINIKFNFLPPVK